jgi:hypothetical protein
VDDLRHEFHCALKYVRGLSTSQPEYPTLADQYGRFLDVVRCLYAGVPYKIGSRFCKARLGERDRSPVKQKDVGPAPRQTLDQAKAAGGLCLLQPHLQCMVESGGFGVSRLGTRLFKALYPNLGGLDASTLPQDKYIFAGQPDVGRRTTPSLPSLVSQDLQSLVHHFVLSGESQTRQGPKFDLFDLLRILCRAGTGSRHSELGHGSGIFSLPDQRCARQRTHFDMAIKRTGAPTGWTVIVAIAYCSLEIGEPGECVSVCVLVCAWVLVCMCACVQVRGCLLVLVCLCACTHVCACALFL